MSVHPRFASFADAAVGWLGTGPGGMRWSDGVFGFLGLRAGEFAPSVDLFLSYVHPRDRQEATEFVAGHLSGSVSFRIVRRTGAVRLVTAASLDLDPGGQERRILLFDLTRMLEDSTGPDGSSAGEAGRLAPGLWALIEETGEFALSPDVGELLGLGRDDRLTLAKFLTLIEPTDRGAVASLLDDDRTGTCSATRLRVGLRRLADGAERHVEFAVARHRGRQGEPLGLFGTLSDVTREVEREAELTRLRAIVARCAGRMSDGLLILGPDGGVLEANSQAFRLLGLAPADNLLTGVPGLAADPIGRFVLDGAPVGCRQDERWVPALGRWLAYSLDRVGGRTLLVLRDQDEVMRLRTSLSEASARWSAALDGAAVALIEIETVSDRISLSGPASTRFDAGATTWSELKARVAEPDRAALQAAVEEAEATGQPVQIEFRLAGPAGGCPVQLRGSWREDGLGRPGRFVGLLALAGLPGARAEVRAPEAGATGTITGVQVRAARGALRWSVRELAEHSDVSVATINRFESGSRTVAARDRSVAALQRVLAGNGIAFFDRSGAAAIAMPAQAVVARQPGGAGQGLEATGAG